MIFESGEERLGRLLFVSIESKTIGETKGGRVKIGERESEVFFVAIHQSLEGSDSRVAILLQKLESGKEITAGWVPDRKYFVLRSQEAPGFIELITIEKRADSQKGKAGLLFDQGSGQLDDFFRITKGIRDQGPLKNCVI